MIHRFTRTAAILIVMALLLPTLAACGTGTLGGVTPTPVAIIPCATDVTINAVTEPTTPAEGTATVPGTPTPGQPSDAPAYSELNAKLEALRKILAGITTPEQYEQQQAPIEKARQELAGAWTALAGRNLKGWEGWVIATGKDAATMGLHMGLEVPESLLDNEDTVLLALFDPFTSDQSAPAANKARGMMTSFAAPEPFVVVSKPSTSGGKALCLGQKVTFDGIADKAFYQGEHIGLYMPQAALTITEHKLADLKPFTGMEGVAVHFERLRCFGFCPDYEVTAFGNGVLLFHGRYFTRIQGFRVATVDQATMQKLLDTLDKANFDTMPSYTNYEITDLPYANITLVRGGKTHTVQHYQGDSTAPESLTTLENTIDEILNTAQWTQ
ncbi:MAG: DUF6438 domain-containing protein [Chloroflexia bacterium]